MQHKTQINMAFDIYGNHLRRGYCEVHPNVHEEYPCSLCLSEDKNKKLQQGERQQPSQSDYYEGQIQYLQEQIEALTKERDQLRDINRTAANFIDKMGDVLVFVHKYGTMPVSQEEECHQLALKASEAGELYKASLPSPPEQTKP